MKKKSISENQIILWKVYLVIFVFILIVGYISVFSQLKAIDWFDLLVSIPSLMSLYALSFNKIIGKKSFWQGYFYAFLIWSLIYNFYIQPWDSTLLGNLESIFGTVIIIPIYIALYIYGFKVLKK